MQNCDLHPSAKSVSGAFHPRKPDPSHGLVAYARDTTAPRTGIIIERRHDTSGTVMMEEELAKGDAERTLFPTFMSGTY